jgi:predicted nucleic acid-binding Zn ribbon protein
VWLPSTTCAVCGGPLPAARAATHAKTCSRRCQTLRINEERSATLLTPLGLPWAIMERAVLDLRAVRAVGIVRGLAQVAPARDIGDVRAQDIPEILDWWRTRAWRCAVHEGSRLDAAMERERGGGE